MVLGATNRPEILDKALLRPGRFDRRIAVDLPDLKGREAVLKVHARPIHMGKDVDYTAIAKATVGASGADLANIINEAALRAVRMGHPAVLQQDLEAAVDTVIAGSERKSLVVPPKEKRMIACHEIGHALVAAKEKNAAPVHKITIIPRTSGALGYTMQVDEDEHVLHSREDLLARMTVLTAGRAAEQFMFGTCTTGASNDIEQLTRLARSMVTRFGMSGKFGMMSLESGGSAYLGMDGQLTCSLDTATLVDQEVQRLIGESFDRATQIFMETVNNQYLGGDTSLACSPETAKAIDDEVIRTVRQQYEKAMGILKENAAKLSQLTNYLLEKETLLGDEFMEILNASAPEALEKQSAPPAESGDPA